MLKTANEDELEEPCELLCELLEDALLDEPPGDPDLPPAPPDEELLLEEPFVLDEALVVPVPDTVSPTSPDRETIVPSLGAYSFVFCTACSSFCTVSLSLLTVARAEARFASRVAALCLVLDELAPCPEALVCDGELDSALFVELVEPTAAVPELGCDDCVVVFRVVVVGVVVVGVLDVPVPVVGAPLRLAGAVEVLGCVGALALVVATA